MQFKLIYIILKAAAAAVAAVMWMWEKWSDGG
jgi:hypothetical protein